MSKSLSLPVLCVLLSMIGLFTACGGGNSSEGAETAAVVTSSDPPAAADGMVATVAGRPISRADYAKWLTITEKSSVVEREFPVIPDPPTYDECIERLRVVERAAGAQLLRRCRRQDRHNQRSTMDLLIRSEWIESEARRRGIEVTESQIDDEIERMRRDDLPRLGGYERYLSDNGLEERDLRFQLRVYLLEQQFTELTRRAARVDLSADRIRRYYDRHRSEFTQPETRDIKLIMANSETEAAEAKQLVEHGADWVRTARRFSTQPIISSTGGLVDGLTREDVQERAFARAAFGARSGEIVGPVRGDIYWYVLQVRAIDPMDRRSLGEARAEIERRVREADETRAINASAKRFRAQWRPQTHCEPGYVIERCANGR